MASQRRHGGGLSRIWILLLTVALVVTAGTGVAVAAQDQFEPNDRPSSAAEIDDGTYEGLSVASDGSDYYEFDLQEGKTLDVTVEFVHEQGDIDLTIYNSEEREIDGSTSTDDDESFTYTAQEDETVHLRVYGYDYHANEYTLTITTDGGSSGSDGDSGSESDGGSSMDGNSMDGSGDDESSSGEEDSGGDDGLPGFGFLVAIGVLATVGVGAVARKR